MASRAVWEPHPSEWAIRGARSPLLLARMIWARRMMKASLERSAVCNGSFSVSESERTKNGRSHGSHSSVSHETYTGYALNTHSLASLYEAFDPEKARRLSEKLEIHTTPQARLVAEHGGDRALRPKP
jgi:hypothetical protein